MGARVVAYSSRWSFRRAERVEARPPRRPRARDLVFRASIAPPPGRARRCRLVRSAAARSHRGVASPSQNPTERRVRRRPARGSSARRRSSAEAATDRHEEHKEAQQVGVERDHRAAATSRDWRTMTMAARRVRASRPALTSGSDPGASATAERSLCRRASRAAASATSRRQATILLAAGPRARCSPTPLVRDVRAASCAGGFCARRGGLG